MSKFNKKWMESFKAFSSDPNTEKIMRQMYEKKNLDREYTEITNTSLAREVWKHAWFASKHHYQQKDGK